MNRENRFKKNNERFMEVEEIKSEKYEHISYSIGNNQATSLNTVISCIVQCLSELYSYTKSQRMINDEIENLNHSLLMNRPYVYKEKNLSKSEVFQKDSICETIKFLERGLGVLYNEITNIEEELGMLLSKLFQKYTFRKVKGILPELEEESYLVFKFHIEQSNNSFLPKELGMDVNGYLQKYELKYDIIDVTLYDELATLLVEFINNYEKIIKAEGEQSILRIIK